MSRIALFPGSFDPLTNGHLDIVRQAIALADHLIMAVGTHPRKNALFTAAERCKMIEESCSAVTHAAGCGFSCITFDDLVTAAAQRAGATVLVRGVRSASDFDYEMEMAAMNAVLAPSVHTVFLPAAALSRAITGTLVRQIASMGGDVSEFVPGPVAAQLKKKFGS